MGVLRDDTRDCTFTCGHRVRIGLAVCPYCGVDQGRVRTLHGEEAAELRHEVITCLMPELESGGYLTTTMSSLGDFVCDDDAATLALLKKRFGIDFDLGMNLDLACEEIAAHRAVAA